MSFLTLLYRWARRAPKGQAYRLQAGAIRTMRLWTTFRRVSLVSPADRPLRAATCADQSVLRLVGAHARTALLRTEVSHVQ